ncbi:uncharacterized protein EDB93DRAFT_1077261 [Suillus bovinus]|uniref:uncharacterized protein n=1 Tax=Suillus bovinus TaxID=48563 RepID=UPI001B876726|nr:uncharacterized protein EDB93DRAFT_1077261 [Suillus bovinus]KAG2158455.1 hypothetical protein EDB93DRAFT_1077261 [Suillus bovinus]
MARDLQSKDPQLQECIKLIREMTSIIDPADDYLTITAAEEQMKINYARGKKENEEAYADLKALSRVLDAAKKSSMRPPNVPSLEKHASNLNELDGSRLSLAKAIRDAEGSLASKEAELAALKEQARSLEESDPAKDHQAQLDGSALRLKIYRGLGFEPVVDKDGRVTKMLVRGESNDIYSFPSDESKSDFDDAAQLWKLASS